MAGSRESTPIEQLIENILSTRLENFDETTIKHAKNRILDIIGCLICGAKDSGNPELMSLLKDWGGKPEATVLVWGDKVPLHNAAMMNCIMARSFDFEPVSPVAEGQSLGGHISGTTVMTAITVGEVKNISGKELITALLVGDDMATRVLIAGKGTGIRPGYDRIGQIDSFGSTAIAGRLLGLNALQMKNAFGIVLNQLGGSQQSIWDTATAFKYSQGTSSRDGILAAQLAQIGWTGPKDALLSNCGYYRLFTEGISDPEILTRNLGKKYYSDGTFKPYPCCRLNHSAIDCALTMVNKHKVEAQDIREVVLYVSAMALNDVLGKPFRIGDFPHASAGFNFRYNIANVLIRKSSKPEHFTEEAIRDPKIGAFAENIQMTELTEGQRESARLTITLKDGSKISEFVEYAKGDPKNPISREELIAKFWGNIDFAKTISRENAAKVLAMIDNLENVDNVRELIQLLVA